VDLILSILAVAPVELHSEKKDFYRRKRRKQRSGTRKCTKHTKESEERSMGRPPGARPEPDN
jgi:hypothetical protein